MSIWRHMLNKESKIGLVGSALIVSTMMLVWTQCSKKPTHKQSETESPQKVKNTASINSKSSLLNQSGNEISNIESKQDLPKQTEEPTGIDGRRVELPDIAPSGKRIRLGLWFDWVTGSGPIIDSLRPLISEPIFVEISEGVFMPRLARMTKPVSEKAGFSGAIRVELRDDVSWSDGSRLSAKQVIFAWDFARNQLKRGLFTPTTQEVKWLTNVNVISTGPRTLELTGVADQEDLENLLSSRLLAPVPTERRSNQSAADWSITLGPWSVDPSIEAGRASAHEEIDLNARFLLVPNQHYFRAPVTETRILSVESMVQP